MRLGISAFGARTRLASTGRAPLSLQSIGTYNVPLEGARLRQRLLRRICATRGSDATYFETKITLRLTRPSVSSGERRVKMFIGDRFVGYMPMVPSMMLIRQTEHWGSDHAAIECAGVIQGGETTRWWRRRPLSIRLDLPLQMDRYPMSARKAAMLRQNRPAAAWLADY